MSQSLHKGKAFTIIFRKEDGEMLKIPSMQFFPLLAEKPLFNKEILESVERNVIVPIIYADVLAEEGLSLKRGVGLIGEYGMGKTLLASYIAYIATRHGWTFIYVKNAAELRKQFASRFATNRSLFSAKTSTGSQGSNAPTR